MIWNRTPRQNRLMFVTLFLNCVNKVEGKIKAIEKILSNQPRYKKIDL
ncbi:DUF1413 domain-containing protein [Thermoanaerobacterium sp. CMT5567-10]|nr:DUF1413 domain-containing protein [Thermoanaerobacterium sp. CMT5567-10]WKV08439.1 DUF1413 domain-containing protein [Thermoanaerobacterium sp. CMT5567-10]